MSEVFLGINKAGQFYVDATVDVYITLCIITSLTFSFDFYFALPIRI